MSKGFLYGNDEPDLDIDIDDMDEQEVYDTYCDQEDPWEPYIDRADDS